MNTEMNIVLPPEADLATAKKESVQKADHIITRVTYTCGLIMEYDLSATHTEIRSNWCVERLPAGQMSVRRP